MKEADDLRTAIHQCVALFRASMSSDPAIMTTALTEAKTMEQRDLFMGFSSILGAVLTVLTEEHGEDFTNDVMEKASKLSEATISRAERQVKLIAPLLDYGKEKN